LKFLYTGKARNDKSKAKVSGHHFTFLLLLEQNYYKKRKKCVKGYKKKYKGSYLQKKVGGVIYTHNTRNL